MTADELHAILVKRTPGRWWTEPDTYGHAYVAGPDNLDVLNQAMGDRNTAQLNAAAIVAAVNVIGPALDVVEAARDALFYDSHGNRPAWAMLGRIREYARLAREAE